MVQRGDVSLDTLGKYLGLSRSGVSRILNEEGYAIMLAHIETMCVFFQTTPSELVAEPGALLQRVQPIAAALLVLFRQMTELERRSLLTILERPNYTQAPHTKRSRLGRAMLTAKEQELVDLFARVKRDGVREGVLKTLRGAAQDEDHPGQKSAR